MDHGLGLISPILELLEIEVFIFSHNPGNIGNLSFPIFYYPGNIGNISFSTFLVSWKYWTLFLRAGGRAGTGRGAAEPSGGPGGGAPSASSNMAAVWFRNIFFEPKSRRGPLLLLRGHLSNQDLPFKSVRIATHFHKRQLISSCVDLYANCVST